MISLVGGLGALTLLVLAAVLARRRRVRSRMRVRALVRDLDECLGSLASALDRALENALVAHDGNAGLGLTLDLDELLTRVAAEAAARTGADAAAVRVTRPGNDPAVGYSGPEDVAALLETALRPPGQRPFRALTINWTLPPSSDRSADGFRSALVVPILEGGVETGAIASVAREPAAFRPEHARALEVLARDAAAGIATALRFGATRRRAQEGGPTAAAAAAAAAPPQPSDDASRALG